MQAHEPTDPLPPGSRTVIVPWSRAYACVAVLLLVALLGGLGAWRLMWGRPPGTSAWAFWALLVPGLVLHELLHGLGFVLGGARIRDVRFGVKLSGGAAYATTATPMVLRHYRVAVALPLVVLGLAPLLMGLAGGWHLATKLGGIFVALAGGDVAILLALRGVRPGSMIVDHQDVPGFHILPDAARAGTSPSPGG